MSKVLEKYVPLSAIPIVSQWLREYHLHLRITKSRRSKFGDFRPSKKPSRHRISVNGDLNPYHFTITLCHEVAHAATWDKYQNKVKPHGQEWKSIYSNLLSDLKAVLPFPKELNVELEKHLSNPKASSCSDPNLYKALKKYDINSSTILLEELEEGAVFLLHNKRKFQKGKKRRTRFECIELASKRLYYVSAHAEVQSL